MNVLFASPHKTTEGLPAQHRLTSRRGAAPERRSRGPPLRLLGSGVGGESCAACRPCVRGLPPSLSSDDSGPTSPSPAQSSVCSAHSRCQQGAETAGLPQPVTG